MVELIKYTSKSIFTKNPIRRFLSNPVTYGNLSSVLLSKLPQELHLIISRKTSEDDWTLAALMEELEQESRPERELLLSLLTPHHKL